MESIIDDPFCFIKSTLLNAMAMLPAHLGSTEGCTASVDAFDPGGDDFWPATLSSNALFGAQPVDVGFGSVMDANDSLERDSAFTPSFIYEFVLFLFGFLPDVRSTANCAFSRKIPAARLICLLSKRD
jgi:hypothetical protein